MTQCNEKVVAAIKEMSERTPDCELLGRAVRNARKRGSRGKHPRWVCVMDAFNLGSTYAHILCRRYNLDPDEMVK